jgi:hypothetical protein
VRSLSRLYICGLLGFAFLAPYALSQAGIVQCPDGEVRVQINVRDVAITYGRSMSVALAELGPFSYKVSLSPVQLQEIATETQRANEFAKVLIAGYNACAISKKDFRDGLFEMSPGFNQTVDVIGRVVARLSQSDGPSRTDQRIVTRVLLALQKVAELDENNTQRILLAIEQEQHGAAVSAGSTEVGGLTQGFSSSLSASQVGVATNLSAFPGNLIVGSGADLTGRSDVQIGGAAQQTSSLTSLPGTQVSFVASLSTFTGNVIVGGGGLTSRGDLQIGGLAQQNLSLTSLPGADVGFAASLPTFSGNAIGGGEVGLTAGGVQIGGLTQQGLSLASIPGAQVSFAASLSTFPTVPGGGGFGDIGLAVTGVWTSTSNLDQAVSALNGALVRSTIPSSPNQYEFPTISYRASDLGSTSVSQFSGLTLTDPKMNGGQINPLTGPPATGTGSELEH